MSAYTFLEAVPAMIESGITAQCEVDALVADLEQIARDDTVFVAQARMPAVWARRA
jgi:hypothetical protein